MSNALRDWSDLIARQANETRLRENEQFAKMQELYPTKVAEFGTMNSEELVSHCISFSQRSCADPRQTKIFEDLANEAKQEILRRLA